MPPHPQLYPLAQDLPLYVILPTQRQVLHIHDNIPHLSPFTSPPQHTGPLNQVLHQRRGPFSKLLPRTWPHHFEPLLSPQHAHSPSPQGHSIECRINAEDPFQNFRPGPGRITSYLAPGGPYTRMDSHIYPDYLVPPNYDSLLGKLIVWGKDRDTVGGGQL